MFRLAQERDRLITVIDQWGALQGPIFADVAAHCIRQ
jgi:hypothetical protein